MSGPLVYSSKGPSKARNVPVSTRLALVLFGVRDTVDGQPSDQKKAQIGGAAYGLSSPNMLQMEPGQSFEDYAEIVYKTAELDGVKPFDVWRMGMEIYQDWMLQLVPAPKEAEEAGTFPKPARE